ncbi:hypothetical protein, partial [Streptomyces pathocidini]
PAPPARPMEWKSMSETAKKQPVVVKPEDEHATGAATTQDEHATGGEATAQDEHATGGTATPQDEHATSEPTN